MKFDGFTFLTALVLFNQLNYLNHANIDSDWLIVACFMRVWSMLMSLLFALKIKFALKIERNAWGIERILYFKTIRESVAVLCSVVKHYFSCFSLYFFPALAVSCVLYSRTEHTQVFSIFKLKAHAQQSEIFAEFTLSISLKLLNLVLKLCLEMWS